MSLKKQALLLEEVQKLNKENAEKSGHQLTPLDLEAGVPPKDQQPDSLACNLVDYLREDSQVAEKHKAVEAVSEAEVGDEEAEEKAAVTEKETKPDVEDVEQKKEEEKLPGETQEESVSADEVSEAHVLHEDEKKMISTRYFDV